jgi:uncharacterized membrane protein YdfJ with MMPL/SSD domain
VAGEPNKAAATFDTISETGREAMRQLDPVQAIGLGLVLAVGLDATIVRLILVPATMTLVGRYNWWAPGPLRRLNAQPAAPTQAETVGVSPR